MGEWTPEGYVRIVGRAKDLIISGGLNVYPKEIEERIDAIDGVAESVTSQCANAESANMPQEHLAIPARSSRCGPRADAQSPRSRR